MSAPTFKLKMNPENNCEEWWSAATSAAENDEYFRDCLNKLKNGESVVVSANFLGKAVMLPGWQNGPPWAPTPLYFDEENKNFK